MLISTGREVHKTRSVILNDGNLAFKSDTFKLQTFDISDKIFLKLYELTNPTLVVCQATVTPSTIFHKFSAYGEMSGKSPNVKFDGRQSTGTLEYEIMYRSSEFTKEPRGQLELYLDSA